MWKWGNEQTWAADKAMEGYVNEDPGWQPKRLKICFEASRRGADTATRGRRGVSGRMKRTLVCVVESRASHGLALGWRRVLFGRREVDGPLPALAGS